jgi:hypothetical protein
MIHVRDVDFPFVTFSLQDVCFWTPRSITRTAGLLVEIGTLLRTACEEMGFNFLVLADLVDAASKPSVSSYL